MPEQDARAKGEQDVHKATKEAITSRMDSAFGTLLKLEGAGETTVAVLTGLMLKILALLMVPEPAFSKIIAILLAAGVCIFLVYIAIKIVVSSLDDFKKIREEAAQQEKEEDDRYSKAMQKIYG